LPGLGDVRLVVAMRYLTFLTDERRYTQMKTSGATAAIKSRTASSPLKFVSIRVHSRFNFVFAPDYLRPSNAGVPIRAVNAKPPIGDITNVEGNRKYADYNAQRGKVREASVNARSNLRQFGSNRSTNRQNRLEWFNSLIWQSSCKST
jgi:hypothetical protein